MTEGKKNPPILKDHVGNVHFAIWKQSAEKDGVPSNFYKATFEVRYRKGDTWKSTDGWTVEGILLKPVGYRPGMRVPGRSMALSTEASTWPSLASGAPRCGEPRQKTRRRWPSQSRCCSLA